MQYKIANQMQEKSKDTKGVIISRTSKKNRQYNGLKKRDKWTNNDLQNHRRTPLNTGVNSDAPERLVASVVLLSAIKRRYQN